ncbi:MAG: hypothetical protein JSW17_06205 [Candidatus Omnitrophota bacterium]|nr:MAG: hypothetical protein JSW17_06205 [Candidatus Omnitrophota bacterium]
MFNLKRKVLVIFVLGTVALSVPSQCSATIFSALGPELNKAKDSFWNWATGSSKKKKKKKASEVLFLYNKKGKAGDGMQLDYFLLVHGKLNSDGTIDKKKGRVRVGDYVTADVVLRNTTAKKMDLRKYGVFIGCRGNDKNRDFGYKKLVLKANESYGLKVDTRVDEKGTWYFWPAYYVNGRWGPYKWHTAKIKVK